MAGVKRLSQPEVAVIVAQLRNEILKSAIATKLMRLIRNYTTIFQYTPSKLVPKFKKKLEGQKSLRSSLLA